MTIERLLNDCWKTKVFRQTAGRMIRRKRSFFDFGSGMKGEFQRAGGIFLKNTKTYRWFTAIDSTAGGMNLDF